jgi:hypothetical protein
MIGENRNNKQQFFMTICVLMVYKNERRTQEAYRESSQRGRRVDDVSPRQFKAFSVNSVVKV